jgi:tRNA-dihydrouridine synthase 2
MNGDVTSRTEALALMKVFNVDGAMIATEAEKNPSCFRPDAEGGPHEWKSQWKTVVAEYMKLAILVENRWGNTKYLLGQMIPGREDAYKAMNRSKCYTDVIKALGLEQVDDLLEKAKVVDQHLGIPKESLTPAQKRQRVKESLQQGEQEQDQEQPEAKRVKVPDSAVVDGSMASTAEVATALAA